MRFLYSALRFVSLPTPVDAVGVTGGPGYGLDACHL